MLQKISFDRTYAEFKYQKKLKREGGGWGGKEKKWGFARTWRAVHEETRPPEGT